MWSKSFKKIGITYIDLNFLVTQETANHRIFLKYFFRLGQTHFDVKSDLKNKFVAKEHQNSVNRCNKKNNCNIHKNVQNKLLVMSHLHIDN